MRQLAVILNSFLVLLLLPMSTQAGVIHGYGCLGQQWAWDFSDSVAVEWANDDLLLFVGFDGSGQHIEVVIAPHGAAIIPDSTYLELCFAPADTSLYVTEQQIWARTAYVIRTAEGHYAKFEILPVLCSHLFHIEYSYQPDGSRRLVDVIAVVNRTWGSIKSLYR